MRAGLILVTLLAQVAWAAPSAGDEWVVLLRWQAMPPAAPGADRHWSTTVSAPPAAAADWPALRLRPGTTASWRQDRWHTDTDTPVATGWTPQGPVLYPAERRRPEPQAQPLQAVSLQALPTRRRAELNLAWSATWPAADADGSSEARGTLTLPPGRWVTLAEWAPSALPGPAANGDRSWSTPSARPAGWRLQARAERP
ncbi:hypothetical protein [Ideonella alba]|uniref:Secreted protein n=1 Tax=Ideonella alba TaxID=2824118 RepID=A0A940YEM6_9BURK|nr:hypothetical protein [Ideonella alba]MBQ0932783.1 hypothetical protein [Ideonella alba]